MFGKFVSVWKEYSNEKNVLVYQFGKVGSTALEKSLPGSIHTHMLYGNSPCKIHLDQRRSGYKKCIGIMGDAIKRVAIRRRNKIRIITIIREPVSRNVSMFFQDMAHWVYKYVGEGNHDNRFAGEEYLENVFYQSFDQKYVQRWFDIEFKKFTNVDLLKENFNVEQGYQIIKQGKFEILVIKYEAFDRLSEAVHEFLGVRPALEGSNVGDDKWYGPLYKDFRRKFIPNKQYLNEMLALPYVRKFYDDEEIKKIRKRYEK